MSFTPELNLKNFHYADFFHSEGLNKLDQQFLAYLNESDPLLNSTLLNYRKAPGAFSAEAVSAFLIETATVLEGFIAELFDIQDSVLLQRLKTQSEDPLFIFKSWYVLREAKRKLNEAETYPDFLILDQWLNEALKVFPNTEDRELAVAQLGVKYLNDIQEYQKEIQNLVQWCVRVMTDPKGKKTVKTWVTFNLPERLDYQNLVTLLQAGDSLGRLQGEANYFRHREGFNLTDHRMSHREILNEANYCIYCHTHAGDFCSTGFPVKKSQPELGLKINPLGEVMTGCPLDEKISEMNFLKKEGHSLAALAVVMIDNPMCPATGHRICNDCMKACIYQKQTPVDIPQVETAVLTDVLSLPWGVEVYDLLTRWNPLRAHQAVMKPFNGYKVLIAGMGPAGFSMAHYLTMEGCAVVGVDGLKIEPLKPEWINQPIYRWADLEEPLDDRLMAGFGGVAEYGITVRWDKNFLKLIYISLMRRQPYFKVFGNVRFGGTFTVEDAFSLGFDHLSVAVGAGLPQAISIPNSLAPGMRQANDFLMNLQLMGAAKKDNLASLQIRLPAVVIGGGLTAVDTATEAQAYYIRQVEKILFHYETLASKLGEFKLRTHFNAKEQAILDEFLMHGRKVRAEKIKARQENRKPHLLSLIEEWGGVTIAYRRLLQESPAYRFNHEELKKALEEGIYYLENMEPERVLLDAEGQCAALVCRTKIKDELGGWTEAEEEKVLPARSVFAATGSKPNIAYEFEHRGTFRRSGQFYDMYAFEAGNLKEVSKPPHVKSPGLGVLTSYVEEGRYVSFLGDTHPAFQGSVVKAIASSFRAYPEVMKVLYQRKPDASEYEVFSEQIDQLFLTRVISIQNYGPDVFEIQVHAPIASKNFRPGQFYRIQTYETFAPKIGHTRHQTEAVAVLGASADSQKGEVSFFIWERGVSSRWMKLLKVGDPVAMMGPTGVRIKIPKDHETVLILGKQFSIPLVLALGKAMRVAGNRVLYVGCFDKAMSEKLLDMVLEATDQIIWIVKEGGRIPVKRPQDVSITGDFISALVQYEKEHSASRIPLKKVNRVIVNGDPEFLCQFKEANRTLLKAIWPENLNIIASVYGSMQCMLKGICAQCLQWQLDPETGERTKAVFSCSWQDQPMELVDIENLSQRLNQNSVQEKLYGLWAQYLSDFEPCAP